MIFFYRRPLFIRNKVITVLRLYVRLLDDPINVGIRIVFENFANGFIAEKSYATCLKI